jgi:hypothetical protein
MNDVGDKVNQETKQNGSGIGHSRHDFLWAGRCGFDTWQGRAALKSTHFRAEGSFSQG